MYSRKFIRGLLIPTFGVGVVHAKGEQEKEECDDTKKLIRARDLPLYVEPPKCVTCSNTIENDDGFLITTIRCARQEFQAIVGQAKVVQNEVQNIVDDVQKETADVVDYLRQEENLLPRFGAIGLGGFAGYLLAIRKGILKKAMYSAAGAGLIAAVAYPNQAKEYTEEVMCEVKKYAVIGYHFLNGADVDWEKIEGIKAPCFARKGGNTSQDTSSQKSLSEKPESYKAEDEGEKGSGASGQSENMVEGANEQSEKKLEGANEQSEKKLEGANEQSEKKLEGANDGQSEKMAEASARPDDPCKEYLEKQKARALRDATDNIAKRRVYGENKVKRSYSEMCREKGACAPKRKKENGDAPKICDSDCSGGRKSKRRVGDTAPGSQSTDGNDGQMKGADGSQGNAANGSDNNAPKQQVETQKPDWLPCPRIEPQQEVQGPTGEPNAPPYSFTTCPPTPPSPSRRQQSEAQNSPIGGNPVQNNGAEKPGRQNSPKSGCQKRRKSANDSQSRAEKQTKNEEDRDKIIMSPREQDSGMNRVNDRQECKPGGQESEKQKKIEEGSEKNFVGPRESGMDNIKGTQPCKPGGQVSEKPTTIEEDREKIVVNPREQENGMNDSYRTQPCKPRGQESEKQTAIEEDREKIVVSPREQESGMDNIKGTQPCKPGGQESEKPTTIDEDREKIVVNPREQENGMNDSYRTQPCKPRRQESEKQTTIEEDREKTLIGPREQESGMDNIKSTRPCKPGGQESESFKSGETDVSPPLPADKSLKPTICPPGCIPEGRMENNPTVMQTSYVNFGKTGDWGNSPIKGEPFVSSDPRRSPIKKSSVTITYPNAPGSADSQVIMPEKVGSTQRRSRPQSTVSRPPCRGKSMKPPANEP